jgi:hypothetical protein
LKSVAATRRELNWNFLSEATMRNVMLNVFIGENRVVVAITNNFNDSDLASMCAWRHRALRKFSRNPSRFLKSQAIFWNYPLHAYQIVAVS